MRLLKDFSGSALVAGFVTVLVGYTSSVVVVFQAARASGAGPDEVASWMWALGIGSALTCIGLSLRYRQPVVTAWSTPGAALLATSAAGLTMPEATGVFIMTAVLTLLVGITGWFERLLARISSALAAAMLAGILLRFSIKGFLALESQFVLVLSMFAIYLAGRRWWPRYAVPGVLALGMGMAGAQGLLHFEGVTFALTTPVLTVPEFSLGNLIGLAVPLFIVNMASQYVPGIVTIRASGYPAPVSQLVTWTALTTLVLAPFGGFAIVLAAITAALCMGPDAHASPARRYVAAVAAGGFYLVMGLYGGTVGSLLAAFPEELVLALAGLALLNTIGSGLATAMTDARQREAALVTFILTASGISLFGIGSAFWGITAGVITLLVLDAGRRQDAK